MPSEAEQITLAAGRANGLEVERYWRVWRVVSLRGRGVVYECKTQREAIAWIEARMSCRLTVDGDVRFEGSRAMGAALARRAQGRRRG